MFFSNGNGGQLGLSACLLGLIPEAQRQLQTAFIVTIKNVREEMGINTHFLPNH